MGSKWDKLNLNNPRPRIIERIGIVRPPTIEERLLGLDPSKYTKKVWRPSDYFGWSEKMYPQQTTKDKVFEGVDNFNTLPSKEEPISQKSLDALRNAIEGAASGLDNELEDTSDMVDQINNRRSFLKQRGYSDYDIDTIIRREYGD